MLRRRLRGKLSQRARQVVDSNGRKRRRGRALQGLNALVSELELPLPRLCTKAWDAHAFDHTLRVLRRRCSEEATATRFLDAVRQWVAAGGCLPPGITLEDDSEVLVEDDPSATAAVVPRHVRLQVSFRLESSAFMLSYNSARWHFDVEALCRGLPGRVAELAARRGDRLCK